MYRVSLRFLDEEESLYEAIKETAKQNHRSLNGEIIHAIEYYLKNAPEAHYQVKRIEKEPKEEES